MKKTKEIETENGRIKMTVDKFKLKWDFISKKGKSIYAIIINAPVKDTDVLRSVKKLACISLNKQRKLIYKFLKEA